MVNHSARLDLVFHALADPTRRAMLQQLRRSGVETVTGLASRFPISLPAVSRHLKVLEQAGMVRRRILGRQHHVTLRREPLDAVAEWVSHYQSFWTERLAALDREVVSRRNR